MAHVERTVVIVNELGLHARPCAEFVKVAGRFVSEISVIREDVAVNGKSIMGVMTLAAERGTAITIRAAGQDAEEAISALEELVARGFHE